MPPAEMEEAKQALDTAEDGEMEGYPNISAQSDEGSPSLSGQADECNPSISANPNTSDQTDDGNHNISVIADERNPDPDISIQAHLNSNPNDSVETNLDPLEESRQNEETLPAYSSLNKADKAPKYTSEATCNPNDAGYGEGRPVLDANGTDKERDKAEESVLANGSLANDPSNADPNDADDQMTPVNEESCGMAASNVHMQEEPPWSGGVIVDAFGTELESQEGNRRLSLKRPRPSCLNNTPSVQVVYNCLTSESKNKLKELLQEWAEWHGKCVGSQEEADKTFLKSGDEMYFPALQIGGGSKATMSFWMDKPSKHARTENATVELTPANQDREKDVPLYDRAGIGALISQETETSIQGDLERVHEGSRCFNCGSYSHSLKECPRPRDNTAINNARKLLAEKRGSANGSRAASRYYQSSPGGKFDDLKPGFLGSETRQLLGIGELDPPPWLNRMRELGYPPGYFEAQEDEPSGITIFGTSEDSAEGSFIGEDGEIVWDSGKKKSVSQKMIVSFPGVNAPIPDDADQHTWGSPAHHSGHGRASYRVTGRTGHSSSFSAAALTSDGTVYTRTDDWEAPPGTGHDSYMKSSKIRSPSFEGASVVYNKTPPWQPNEQGRSGIAASSRSPYLGRSSSDSGRSPKVPYDEPRTLPPLGGPSSGPRQSSIHSLRPYPSPLTPSQRLPYGQEYREDGLESRQRAWAQAHGALQSMHHNGLHSPSRHRSNHF